MKIDQNRIKAIELSKKGMSTREIASEIGVNHTTIARWLKASKGLLISKCPVCGKDIVYTGGHRPKKFCSDRCCLIWFRRHQNTMYANHTLTCEHCGKLFKSAKKHQRFCSRQCYLDEVCGK